MIYGYCRVSSKCQVDNNSIEGQTQEILSRYPDAIIVTEQYTGTTVHRPVLDKLLNDLQSNDMLVVAKLDRLARTTTEGIDLIQDLFNRNIAVHVLNVGLLENTSMGKFFVTTLLAVAELERNMILERTQNGKAIARQSPDFVEGRPKKFKRAQLSHAMSLLSEHSYREVVEMTGISKSTLIRAKRAEVAVQK